MFFHKELKMNDSNIQRINGIDYEIIKEIARTRIANIWLCKPQNSEQLFILKVSKDTIPEFIFDDSYTLEEFKDTEIFACQALQFLRDKKFPFICKCEDFGIIPHNEITVDNLKSIYNSDIAYTLIEYVSGSTLGSENFKNAYKNIQYNGIINALLQYVAGDIKVNNNSTENTEKTIVFCSSILSSLHLLMSNNLFYNDLHEENIIFNDKLNCYTLIDLGSVTNYDNNEDMLNIL